MLRRHREGALPAFCPMAMATPSSMLARLGSWRYREKVWEQGLRQRRLPQ
jgi:hypothetical protein